MTDPQKDGAIESNAAESVSGAQGKALDDYLLSMERDAHFMGSVLIEQAGQVLLRKGYGKANEASKNTPSTVFQIASLTKQFTAAAIMKLREENRVDLDSSINIYLPKQCQCKRWRDVKVNHLLTHQSGIPDYTDCDDYWKICKDLTFDSVIEQAKEERLEFAPGSDYCYSNTGYDLLGKIIEEQTKMPYGEFITQKLLIPAGMASSGLRGANFVPASNAAIGYYVENLKLVRDPRDEFSVLYADGAMYSTVGDLSKWSKVLDGESQVLSQESVKWMVSHQFGLVADKLFGHKRIHHNGSMAGFSADFCKYPDDRILIVILGNNVDFVVDYLTGNISKYLFENQPLTIVEPFPEGFDFIPYERTFVSDDEESEDTYTFKRHKEGLILQGDDDPIECLMLSNGHIFIPSEGTEYLLQKNGAIIVNDCDGKKIDTLIPSY
jgi:CubicO group peptidase (beta-lactamase class C family)